MKKDRNDINRCFLIQPIKDGGEPYLYFVPMHIWRADVAPLYKPLDSGCVQRLLVLTHDGVRVWMWVDEEGGPHAKPVNAFASAIYQNRRAGMSGGHSWILGTVAYELGTVDGHTAAEMLTQGKFLVEQDFGQTITFNELTGLRYDKAEA